MTLASAAQLLIACILGAAIGTQRQVTGKPAGLRTHALVALGSCAFAMISSALGDSRIAAGVITGVGFLGAGAIVRQGLATRGLTTAASIWTASAAGLAVGIGVKNGIAVGVAVTVITLIMLSVSDVQLANFAPRRRQITIAVTAHLGRIGIDDVGRAIGSDGAVARQNDIIDIANEDGGRVARIEYVLRLDVKRELHALVDRLSRIDGIERVAVVDEPSASN